MDTSDDSRFQAPGTDHERQPRTLALRVLQSLTLRVTSWQKWGTLECSPDWGLGLGPACLSIVLVASPVQAEDYVTLWVNPGESIDVYWNVNLSGKVYLIADVGGNPGCLDYWWIVWPFTQIKKLGRHCGRVEFDLPSMTDWAIGGKLRAGGATMRTRLRGSALESVAHGLPELNF